MLSSLPLPKLPKRRDPGLASLTRVIRSEAFPFGHALHLPFHLTHAHAAAECALHLPIAHTHAVADQAPSLLIEMDSVNPDADDKDRRKAKPAKSPNDALHRAREAQLHRAARQHRLRAAEPPDARLQRLRHLGVLQERGHDADEQQADDLGEAELHPAHRLRIEPAEQAHFTPSLKRHFRAPHCVSCDCLVGGATGSLAIGSVVRIVEARQDDVYEGGDGQHPG